MTLVSPLLREIPGGIIIYNIISNLSKNDTSKVISIMPNLVRIMLLTKFDLNLNLTDEKIEEKIKQLRFTETFIEGAVAWISSLVILINKNTAQFTIEYYKKIFNNMVTTLEKYEDEVDSEIRIVKNAMRPANIIMMILGLWRGDFELIGVLASEIGWFDGKVKELYLIFNKYKDIIFKNEVIGLPKLRSHLTEAQIKQGLNLAADLAKKALKDITSKGLDMAKDIGRTGIIKLIKAEKLQMEEFSKMVPGSDKIAEATMVFSDMFRRFDVDNNGFINFNKYWELTRYMGLQLDKERTLKLFATADRDNDNKLDLREFQVAMLLIKLYIAEDTLKKVGLTREDLIWFAIFGIIYLLLLFVFILCGIAAFSKAEGFNSVVNSIMPMFAGIAAAARNIDLKAAIEKVKIFVEDILKRMHIG